METEKDKSNSKRCYGCFYFRRHYTKGMMKFNKEKTGLCISNDKVVGNKDTCGGWRGNHTLRRRMSQISVKALNETIAMLVEITSVIKEDIENKNLSQVARERYEQKLDEIEAELEKENC